MYDGHTHPLHEGWQQEEGPAQETHITDKGTGIVSTVCVDTELFLFLFCPLHHLTQSYTFLQGSLDGALLPLHRVLHFPGQIEEPFRVLDGAFLNECTIEPVTMATLLWQIHIY